MSSSSSWKWVHLVDGLKRERIGPIMGPAIGPFNAFDRPRRELEGTTSPLRERRTIDWAKGFLTRAKASA